MDEPSNAGARATGSRGGTSSVEAERDVAIQPAFEEVTTQPSLEQRVGGQAADLASEATSAAASLSADLRDAATSMGRAVKEQASAFAAGVGSELGQTAENQKTKGVEAIQLFARAISAAARELEGQSPRVARSVRDAAGKVEGFSNNVGSRNMDELMRAATDLARSQPILFIGGAVAAGFALSQFLKSSAGGPAQS